MADPGDEIRRLMARGLDLYALGQVEEATACWRQVLARDPANAEARDYLQAAAGDADAAAAKAVPGPGGMLAEALRLLRAGSLQEGLELLETVASRAPDDLEVQGFLELARGALLRTYRARVGSGTSTPHVRAAPAEVMKYNLPASAGFLLSLIDGRLSVDELLAVSSMDPFETLRALSKLLDSGIVEARA